MEAIKDQVRTYILDEFLPGEDPENLTDTTPLITGGVLDSLATLKVVDFLEKSFGIELAAHEADATNLDSVADIVALIQSKQS